MDEKKLQPYLDKMKIVFKEPCKKWDMDRYHYGIKIGDEVFNYYGRNKEFEDEERVKKYIDNYNRNFTIEQGAKYLKLELPTTDDIKKDALYALVNDYWTYEDYNMEDFIDSFDYRWNKVKEGIRVYKELEINHSRMQNVFTTDELRLLQDLYQDF